MSSKKQKIVTNLTYSWRAIFNYNVQWRKLPFVLFKLNACDYLAPLSRYGASKIMESRPWPFGVTWRHRSRNHSTYYGWSIVTMRLSCIVMEINVQNI